MDGIKRQCSFKYIFRIRNKKTQLNVQRVAQNVVQSGLHLPVGAVGGAVVFGEGLELQRVEGVLSASHVLHGVFTSAALAEEKRSRDEGETNEEVKVAVRRAGVKLTLPGVQIVFIQQMT